MIIKIDNNTRDFLHIEEMALGASSEVSSRTGLTVDVVFDLSDLTNWDEIRLICLFQLVAAIRSRGLRYAFLPPEDQEIAKRLVRMKWYESFQAKEMETFYYYNDGISFIPCRGIRKEEAEFFVMSTSDWLKTEFPGTDYNPIELILKELLNNVFDHAASPLPATIYASLDVSSQKLRVIVADYGIGIMSRTEKYYNRMTENDISDELLLTWALKRTSSTHSTERNRGFGLDSVYSIVIPSQGKLTFYCGGNKYKLAPNYAIDVEQSYMIKGTVVDLTIPLSALDEAGDEDNFHDEISF